MGVDDGDEDRECGRCHETMHIPPGAEPSEFCHDCAHNLVDELRARVAELEYVAGLMWDRYEDGEPCYEGMTDDDTGTYTGQAVYFSDEETARILAAIPEERLPGNKEGSREEA